MLEYTTEAPPRVAAARLASVERSFDLRFPDVYRDFLLVHNGGRPVPANFLAVENSVTQWMRVHFFFGIDDRVESNDLIWKFKTFQNRLPERVLSIADDECGNLFCLDLRNRKSNPVLFWNRTREPQGKEQALTATMAQSFSEWIQMFCAET